MPETKPVSFSISASRLTRSSSRCASTSLPSARKTARRSSSSRRISETMRPMSSGRAEKGRAGTIVVFSRRWIRVPVVASTREIFSISSPKKPTRRNQSSFAGRTSTTSPRTRKQPRAAS